MPTTSNQPGKSLKDLWRCQWKPQPVNPPKVDPQLPKLDPLTRAAEAIRHALASLEFWISPDGQVREWLRHNSRLAFILAIPVFLVLPVVTFGLWQFVSWLTAILSIAGKLIIIPILIVLAAVAIMVAGLTLRILFK